MPDLAERSRPCARRLEAILTANREFRANVVPLCAAETPMSDYTRSFLMDPIHERYAMGGPLNPEADDFVGAEFVHQLHELAIDLSRAVFGVRYADPRPLSGMGAITNLLMTLSKPGQKVLLQTSDSGGHSSIAPICRRLGLEVFGLPYDYDRFDCDTPATNDLALGQFDFVMLAPSDILYAPALDQLNLPPATTLIYDATQTLGLIASRHLPSPFSINHSRFVVCAGTHKTLPGPSNGLILTDNLDIATELDAQLNPRYLRHVQPHHMASVCATLIEQQEIGDAYSCRIQHFVRVMSAALISQGLTVLQREGQPSETHQVFLHIPEADLSAVYGRAVAAGVTLNKKVKPLFRNTGLRLGLQEIARYRWEASDVEEAAELLGLIVKNLGSPDDRRCRAKKLATNNVFRNDPAPRTRQAAGH